MHPECSADKFALIIAYVVIFSLVGSNALNYLACFKENSANDRLMKGAIIEFRHTLTPEICLSYCKTKGMRYFGLQYSYQCFCSIDRPQLSSATDENECDLKCEGNPRETCGGALRLSVYDSEEDLRAVKYMGCYKERSPNARLMNAAVEVFKGTLTNQKCFEFCQNKGFSYAGTQFMSECYCSNERPYFKSSADEEDCSSKCDGNKEELCGGEFRLSVYDLYDKNTDYVYSSFLGCYEISPYQRDLLPNRKEEFKELLSPEYCVGYCYRRGYRYAGMESGNSCYCGDSLDSNSKINDVKCNSPCAGNKKFKCGGQGKLSVYHTEISDVSEEGRLLGCYAESSKFRTLSGIQIFFKETNTPKLCLNVCLQLGFKYAGVQYERECFCGNRPPSADLEKPESECSMTCPGDRLKMCGGEWRLLVFSTGGSSKPSVQSSATRPTVSTTEKATPSTTRKPSTQPKPQTVRPSKNKNPTIRPININIPTTNSWSSHISKTSVTVRPSSETSKQATEWASQTSNIETPILWWSSQTSRPTTVKQVYTSQPTTEKQAQTSKSRIQRPKQSIKPTTTKPSKNVTSSTVRPADKPNAAVGNKTKSNKDNSKPSQSRPSHSNSTKKPSTPKTKDQPPTTKKPKGSNPTTGRPQTPQKVQQTQNPSTRPQQTSFTQQSTGTSKPNQQTSSVQQSSWSTQSASYKPNTQQQVFSSQQGGFSHQSEGTASTPQLPGTFTDREYSNQGTNYPNQQQGSFSTNQQNGFTPQKQSTFTTQHQGPINSQLPGLSLQPQESQSQQPEYVTLSADSATSKPTSCIRSMTEIRGKNVCKGQTLFYDDFSDGSRINKFKWNHEVIMPWSPDYEFVVYRKNGRNSFIRNNRLHIQPTLLDNDFVKRGYLELDSCTGLLHSEECRRQGATFNIIPPIESARLTTKETFSFKYGKIQIRAKLPLGDWIVPEIWLEPKTNDYGTAAYASGRVRIAMARGNGNLEYDSRDIGNRQLEVGVLMGVDENIRARTIIRDKLDGWWRSFHNYTLIWTPDNLKFLVDGQHQESLASPGKPLFQLAGFDDTLGNTWKHGSLIAPFDKEFYVTLGLSVGGMRDFPDDCRSAGHDKPWKNMAVKGMASFWEDRRFWQNSWDEENSSLQIEHVIVTAL